MQFYRSANVRYGYILLLILLPLVASPQVLVLREAEKHMLEGRYEEALSALQYLKDTEADLINLDYKMRICYILSHESRVKSIDAFFEEFKDFQNDSYFHYWNGKVNLKHFRYAPAIESFKVFLESQKPSTSEFEKAVKDATYLTEVLQSIESFSISSFESPVNTYYAEINPVLVAGGQAILFTSDRSEEDTFKLYKSETGQYGWNTPKSIAVLEGDFASTNGTSSLIHFEPASGTLAYFEYQNGDLIPVGSDEVPALKGAETVYVNKHKNRIIFSAKAQNGKTDLYEILKLRTANEWMAPTSLPGLVNSESNENYPFLSEDRKSLYFSSDKPGGIGGKDVYMSTFDEATLIWSKPVNVGLPINSADDEICFKVNQNNLEGSFSSNRIGSVGDFDSYMFRTENVVSIK